MNDPRHGLPSASSMHRVKECPGSVAMVNALRASGKYFELENPYAPGGLRIHRFLAETNGQTENLELEKLLTADEMGVARKCQDQRMQILRAWHGDHDESEPLEFIVEKRLKYRVGMELCFTGQPDFIAINRTRAIILNYKTGRIAPEAAADNLQLRTEVVLLKHVRPDLEEIDAAIIEPLVEWDPERVHYAGADLVQAEWEIVQIANESAWNDKRTAGPWCRFCPARCNCLEALQLVETIPNPSVSKLFELPRGQPGIQLWEKIGVAQGLLEDLKATYRRILLIEPQALFPEYYLPELGHENRKVTDLVKFKEALSVVLSAEEIDKFVEVSIGKVQTAYGEKVGISGKKLATEFRRLTERSVLIGNDQPFIQPIPKKMRELKVVK